VRFHLSQFVFSVFFYVASVLLVALRLVVAYQCNMVDRKDTGLRNDL